MNIVAPDHPTPVKPSAASKPENTAVTAEILWDQQAITAVLPEWQALVDAVQPTNFFLRPAVWESWTRQLSGAKPSGLMLAYKNQCLVGVMPVMIRTAWRGPTLGVRYDYDPQDRRWLTEPARRIIPMRQLSPVLSLPATMLGPVLLAADAHRPAVITAMAAAISMQREWDMAVFPLEQRELELWKAGFTKAGLRCDEQTLDRPGFGLRNITPFDQIIAQLNKKGRQNHRRAVAAAAKSGVTLSICQDAPDTMAIVRDLAAQSWKAKGRSGQHTNIPFDGMQGAFFDDLMLGADKSRLVSAIASQNGTPIAIIMGGVTGDTLTTLLTYWNGAESAASPGFLTLGAIIDWAAQNRIDQIDFNSNSPWLKSLGDHSETQQNLLVFACGARGRSLATLRRAGLGLKSLRDLFRSRQSDKAAEK